MINFTRLIPLIRSNVGVTIILIVVVAAYFALTISLAAGNSSETASVIPLPVSIEYDEGCFLITSSTRIFAEGAAVVEASKLIDALAPPMGFRLNSAAVSEPQAEAIRLELDRNLSQLGEEGYVLKVTSKHILMRARQPALSAAAC